MFVQSSWPFRFPVVQFLPESVRKLQKSTGTERTRPVVVVSFFSGLWRFIITKLYTKTKLCNNRLSWILQQLPLLRSIFYIFLIFVLAYCSVSFETLQPWSTRVVDVLTFFLRRIRPLFVKIQHSEVWETRISLNMNTCNLKWMVSYRSIFLNVYQYQSLGVLQIDMGGTFLGKKSS